MFKGKSILAIVLWIGSLPAISSENESRHHIEDLLNQYQRPITVMEICGHNSYSLKLAQKYKAGTFVIKSKQGNLVCKTVQRKALHNVVVLNPTYFNPAIIKILGRCEYFDVVIVHDMPMAGIEGECFIRSLSMLADFVFIEMPAKRSNFDYTKYGFKTCQQV